METAPPTAAPLPAPPTAAPLPASPTAAPVWSLDELVATANAVLADAGVATVDARTVRYWRSVGAVSAPAGSGRAARWGWRHLLEVVATRRAQRDRQPVGEVARRHATASDIELAELAELPAQRPSGWRPPVAAAPVFWDPAVTAPTQSPPGSPAAGAPASQLTVAAAANSVLPTRPEHRVLVELSAGVAVALPVSVAADLERLSPVFDQLVAAVVSAKEDLS